VKKGSVADITGGLQADDEIIKLNGRPLRGLTEEQVSSIVNKSRQHPQSGQFELVLERPINENVSSPLSSSNNDSAYSSSKMTKSPSIIVSPVSSSSTNELMDLSKLPRLLTSSCMSLESYEYNQVKREGKRLSSLTELNLNRNVSNFKRKWHTIYATIVFMQNLRLNSTSKAASRDDSFVIYTSPKAADNSTDRTNNSSVSPSMFSLNSPIRYIDDNDDNDDIEYARVEDFETTVISKETNSSLEFTNVTRLTTTTANAATNQQQQTELFSNLSEAFLCCQSLKSSSEQTNPLIDDLNMSMVSPFYTDDVQLLQHHQMLDSELAFQTDSSTSVISANTTTDHYISLLIKKRPHHLTVPHLSMHSIDLNTPQDIFDLTLSPSSSHNPQNTPTIADYNKQKAKHLLFNRNTSPHIADSPINNEEEELFYSDSSAPTCIQSLILFFKQIVGSVCILVSPSSSPDLIIHQHKQ
jgi:hypothetical protein